MEAFPEIFSENNIGFVVKIFQLLVMVFFVIYSFLTIRQVDLMNNSVHNPIHLEVKVAAYLQLFIGIGVFLIILIR